MAYKVTVQGPHVASEDAPDHRDSLLSQLKDIPKDITTLTLAEDPPSNSEWDILSSHFTSVRDLTMDSGWNEDLNDRKMPLHWPLERLTLSSPCGEVIESPHILQGRVRHLVLYLTSGLRFEGPTSPELTKTYQQAIERCAAEKQYLGESKIQLINTPELAVAWMKEKYTAVGEQEASASLEPDNRPVEGQESRMRTLEIIENDALDTFQRMSLALPHVIQNLTSLTLHSTNIVPDFNTLDEGLFLTLLPSLTNLTTLTLSIGESFHQPSSLPALFTRLPQSLTTLHFRGPISLIQSPRWEEWIAAFKSETYLPNLQHLAFVLDLHYTQENENGLKRPKPAPEKDLCQARAACERVHEAARNRGISIQPLSGAWADLILT
ncbi:hypothetical protein BJX70DRAFT_47659 [Aspergillus crustosus]